MTTSLQYVLITPARNEEAFIRLTIESVVHQTIRPLKWVIVSDGSTDRTDEIVTEYVRQHSWIELLRMPEREARHFAGKVGCFNAGFARVQDLPFDIVGSLDADISFDEQYFSFLLDKFSQDPKLGVAGTPFVEDGSRYNYKFSSTDHVSGACQLFRRQCYTEIGGYVPLKGGGIDVVAVMTARLKGWRTQTFPEKTCNHHRPMGLASSSTKASANFRLGQRAYALGWHPAWQVFRSIYQASRKPYVIGGFSLLAGYLWAMIRRAECVVSPELVEFQRRDQMRRLRAAFRLHSL